MCGLHHCRWFPAVVLGAVFPVALVAQSALLGSSEDSAAAITDVSDVTPAASVPEIPRIQLPPKEQADIDIARKNYQAALREYQQAEPRTAAVWNGMGIAYQMLFDTRDALHCYEQAVHLDPRNRLALNNLATVYDSLRDYRTAERFYRKSLRLDPHSAVTLKNLGTNLLMQHKDAQGQQLYRQAIEIDPAIFGDDSGAPIASNAIPIRDLGRANYLKARSCARTGIVPCALDYLRRAINEGAVDSKMIAAESDFNDIRSATGFQHLLAICP